MAKSKPTRNVDSLTEYIVDVELKGKDKSEAYLSNVDSSIKNPKSAVKSLEASDSYAIVREQVIKNLQLDAQTGAAKSMASFFRVYDKSLTKIEELLDTAEGHQEVKSALSEFRATMKAHSQLNSSMPQQEERERESIDLEGIVI